MRAVAVGTAIWALSLLALLPFQARLRADGHLWWYGVCAWGVGLGLVGLRYCQRRAAAIARDEAREGIAPLRRSPS